MNLYTKFCANILFPLHEKLKGHDTVKIKKSLEKSQWLSQDELKLLQLRRLKKFIEYCYKNVPYYQTTMDKLGIQPTDITSLSDLSRLPFLTKSVITANFTSLTSQTKGPVSEFRTGGSSGEPLKFLLGKERVSHDVAEKWRATRWWGVDIGDKEIVAWGSPIELDKQDRIKHYRDKLLRTELIPAFDLTDTKIRAFIDKIISERPPMLFGYPSVFHLLANYAQEHNIEIPKGFLKVIFVTSERLYPYQRKMIESVFGTPVANGYGGRDAGFIAHECPQGNMHISDEEIIVEIVDEKGNAVENGQRGEIVVTHLATSDFPFIRYKTGDIGALSDKLCSCGRGLRILGQIEGRTTDFITASNGTKMHGLALIYILRDRDEIKEFKIIQKTLLLTQVQLVTNDKYSQHTEDELVHAFKERLGEDVTIEFSQVDQIEPETSGKFRYVISEIT